MAQYLILDSFPTDMLRISEAESKYYEIVAGAAGGSIPASGSSTLVSEIVKARQQIQKSLDGQGDAVPAGNLDARVIALEESNELLSKTVSNLASVVESLKAKVAALEGTGPTKASVEKPVPKQQEKGDDSDGDDDDEDDDDFDLFGEDDNDEEEREKIKAERVAAYNAKKATKKAIIAKSSVLLDVKPWDDETDMALLEKEVRTIVMDGLVWGASKLVPVGYGIKKLQIMCVVEDDKVSVDDLTEQICEFEDFVQSVDIAAFSKI